MRPRIAFACGTAVVALLAGPVLAQQGPWTAHTAMREALSVDAFAGTAWVGTSGGLFYYDAATAETKTYTVVDGLHSVSASTVAYDRRRNAVWIGYPDGVLDLLDAETSVVRSFRDIQRATQFSSRRINGLKLVGDTLYVSTDFGLIVFDAERAEVRDSYTRFGSLSPAIPVYDFDIGPLPDGSPGIWVATEEGVAFADRTAINLQDPSVWSAEAVAPGSAARSIAVFGDSVYVGLDDGLRVRTGPAAYDPRGTPDLVVGRLVRLDDRVVGVSVFRVFQVDAGGAVTAVTLSGVALPKDVAVDEGGNLWVADGEAGLAQVEAGPPDATSMNVIRIAYPDGPRDGLFMSSSVAPDGSVLFGGVPGPGRGFYHLGNDGTWTSYHRDAYPAMGDRASFLVVNADAENNLWAASEGGGVVRVGTDGDVVLFAEDNSTLRSVSGVPGFILATGVDNDSDNNTWVTTLGSALPLHLRTPENTWAGLPPYVGQGLTNLSNAYGRLYIDSFDQKWIVVRDESAFSNTRGLLVVDTGANPADPDDDSFRFFSSVGGSGQGLPSINVTAVVEDRSGLLWVGTDRGLAYAVNTGTATRDGSTIFVWPQQADRTQGPFLFFGLPITALAVDPANRLWVGTEEGVRIVEAAEGGFREVGDPITTSNAPLPSDVIVSISVEPATGTVYVVTDGGLVSTEGEAVEPVAEIAELFVFPNPADFTSGAPEIFIEGLSENSTVTIVTGSGARVRRLEARGGRIRWDGMNDAGEPVPSGVYVVVGVGAEGGGTGYGKVVVVR